MILYLMVLLIIVIGEIVLYTINDNFSFSDLAQDIIGNLMGVLGAFLVFDIAHEKISKDSYASEVSEQILDTLMYHPETMELYDNEQKKTFVSAFIGSVVKDDDVKDMIDDFMKKYLLTKKDYEDADMIRDKECRIRTAFSYRFILESERSEAFKLLTKLENGEDPYFYVQEELSYKVKFLSPRGNNIGVYENNNSVSIGFIFNNQELDRFLRGSKEKRQNDLIKKCIFRESLEIEPQDYLMFLEKYQEDKKKDTNEFQTLITGMFRPHVNIDGVRGTVSDVELIENRGIIITYELDSFMENDEQVHMVDIVFHMPKKWNTLLEVALVEPTKDPRISLSYNEDTMEVEMYSFLNRGDSTAYENTYENENGIYSVMVGNEWVFPISGIVFPVTKKNQ